MRERAGGERECGEAWEERREQRDVLGVYGVRVQVEGSEVRISRQVVKESGQWVD